MKHFKENVSTLRDGRLGGEAGNHSFAYPRAPIKQTAIDNAIRRSHDRAPAYGDVPVTNLADGEISQADLRRHLADGDDTEARKDTR
jgi:hypothetical protein